MKKKIPRGKNDEVNHKNKNKSKKKIKLKNNIECINCTAIYDYILSKIMLKNQEYVQ